MPRGSPEHPSWPRSWGEWDGGGGKGPGGWLQEEVSSSLPGSISRLPLPRLPLLQGHLLAPWFLWHSLTVATTKIYSYLRPLSISTCPAPQRRSYPVGCGWQRLNAEQQAVRQAEVAVAVALEVLAPPHQLVDFQAHQPSHRCCGGDDGRHNPPSNPLALRTGGMSVAAPHRTGTPDPTGCPSHHQPVSRGDAIVLCTQVGGCCDEVHMDVIVLWRRAWRYQHLTGTSIFPSVVGLPP